MRPHDAVAPPLTAASAHGKARTFREIGRYSLVTPFVGLTDFAAYYAGLRFLATPAAKGAAFVIAGVVGYLLNKHVTFSKPARSASEMTRYAAVQVFLIGFNVAANEIALALSGRAVFGSMAAASVLTAVMSFICKKWWVFR